MICPKCKSENTYKPITKDSRWFVGAQICGDCDYISNWAEFCMAVQYVTNSLKKDS